MVCVIELSREDRGLTLLSVGLCSRVLKLSFSGEGSLRKMKTPLFLDFSGFIEPLDDLIQPQRFKYLLTLTFSKLNIFRPGVLTESSLKEEVPGISQSRLSKTELLSILLIFPLPVSHVIGWQLQPSGDPGPKS